ncbi:MAG: zinc-binding alcohol dehydrogenase family protein [Planctomycetota bacterium]
MKKMLALAVVEAKPDANLTVTEIDFPKCPVDGVVVKNQYIGINKGDAIRRQRGMFGAQPQIPIILGFEAVGEIVEIGEQVSGWNIGDYCAYLVPSGAFAEYTAVSKSQLIRIPKVIASDLIAGTICIGLTAAGLLQAANVNEGDRILVQGASGAVAQAIIQLAKRRKLDIYASVSNINHIAEQPIEKKSLVLMDAPETFKTTIGAQGVSTVFDGLGSASLDLSLAAVRPGGQILYYGSASGHADFPGLSVLMNHLTVKGFIVFECSSNSSLWSMMCEEYTTALSSGDLAPPINIVNAENVMEVFRLIDSRSSKGRFAIDARSLSNA